MSTTKRHPVPDLGDLVTVKLTGRVTGTGIWRFDDEAPPPVPDYLFLFLPGDDVDIHGHTRGQTIKVRLSDVESVEPQNWDLR